MIQLDFHKELEAAEHIVLQAAALTKKVLSSVQELSKADASPVTVADFAAQALIIGSLRRAFPRDAFVGEEDAAALRADPALRARVVELVRAAGAAGVAAVSEDEVLEWIDLGGKGRGGRQGRFWVMDPVDGTATFLRGEQYAVALALVEDGREVLGVVCCPNLRPRGGRVREDSVDEGGMGVMISAVRGQGAMLRVLADTTAAAAATTTTTSTSGGGGGGGGGGRVAGVLPEPQPLPRLEAPRDLAGVHIVDYERAAAVAAATGAKGVGERLAERMGAAYPGTRVWSSHVRYAALALGGGHVLLRVPKPGASSYIWDHAGAQLIFREMGGKVTDLEGNEIDFGRGRELQGNWGLLATVGDIHGEVLKLLREVLQETES
ncbi:hypothetical protein ESCO_000835 [Escovopsis weberi]|uniref:3'(2'),5'-bisphosphate nucleotidase n=1 Tax=Escovopsis weberi TaxID=150374 RepID=A0A0M8MU81_ESCWE|nr:hypothetical protein ESCO_000835 [Escovopsis weberi]